MLKFGATVELTFGKFPFTKITIQFYFSLGSQKENHYFVLVKQIVLERSSTTKFSEISFRLRHFIPRNVATEFHHYQLLLMRRKSNAYAAKAQLKQS